MLIEIAFCYFAIGLFASFVFAVREIHKYGTFEVNEFTAIILGWLPIAGIAVCHAVLEVKKIFFGK